ncbi:unnamed protein product [Sphenostylis stenocarpa]|uniref:Uncharacterized protein n=1 Tax=Sphenostylis stenocarpa TaxID=92480 RepID=A0AA86SJZ0_9FABA|nr:unnamed protein product [Sphenostylis stenocarpa]
MTDQWLRSVTDLHLHIMKSGNKLDFKNWALKSHVLWMNKLPIMRGAQLQDARGGNGRFRKYA